MNKYLIVLSNGVNPEFMKERLAILGARNIKNYGASNHILEVDSPVELHLASEHGVESYQQLEEVESGLSAALLGAVE